MKSDAIIISTKQKIPIPDLDLNSILEIYSYLKKQISGSEKARSQTFNENNFTVIEDYSPYYIRLLINESRNQSNIYQI